LNVGLEPRRVELDIAGIEDEAVPAVQAMFSPLRELLEARVG
jgi:hypothetical protein